MDLMTRSTLGYYYFPNSDATALLLTLAPLAALLSVQVNVIVSSRISDVRTGQQLGALTVLPLAGLYVAGELNLIDLGSTTTYLFIIGALLLVDVLLFFVSRATFRREEILTRWK
jgi:ABC-2 type transport system permease protein